jgi:hypothetical protein
MKIASLVLLCLLYVDLAALQAGDAVVIGYNSQGVWTMVTYYASSSASGGRDYKEAAEARKAALQDLRRHDRENIAKTEVLSDSDATGYVAVARGKTESGKDVTVVGRGKSQDAAEAKAIADLTAVGATASQKIVYHYFSYGTDSDSVKQ